MTTKHTPGPWRVERQNPSPTTGEWMIAGSRPGYLAEVRDCGSGDVQANAQLIAASPELLAQAMAVVERLRGMAIHPSHYAELESVVTKATCPTCTHGRGFHCPICWPVKTKE